MAFSTQCTNKGCGKIQEPYIDPQSDKVYCSICDGEISNLTHFVKIQMKTTKQFRQKKSVPFAVKCLKCNAQERPKIVNDEVICSACKQQMTNISPIYKNMLKEALKTVDKDV